MAHNRLYIFIFFLFAIVKIGQCLIIAQEIPQDSRMDKLLDKLTNTVQVKTEKSKELIELTLKQLSNYILNTGSSANKSMENDEDVWSLRLSNLKKEAEKNKIDISACLISDEERLSQLLPVNQKNMTDCFHGVQGKAIESEQVAYHEMNIVQVKLVEVKQEARNCQEDTECLNKMSLKIQTQFSVLPQQIQAAVDETITTITTLESTASNCALKATNYLETDGKEIFDRIVSCVNSKK